MEFSLDTVIGENKPVILENCVSSIEQVLSLILKYFLNMDKCLLYILMSTLV